MTVNWRPLLVSIIYSVMAAGFWFVVACWQSGVYRSRKMSFAITASDDPIQFWLLMAVNAVLAVALSVAALKGLYRTLMQGTP